MSERQGPPESALITHHSSLITNAEITHHSSLALTELYAEIKIGLSEGEVPAAIARRLGCRAETVTRQQRLGAGVAGKGATGLWVCDDCGKRRRLPLPVDLEPVECMECGGALWPPVPAPELIRRLRALIARLEEEDGPLVGVAGRD